MIPRRAATTIRPERARAAAFAGARPAFESSRPSRGCHMDIPMARGPAAGATWIFLGLPLCARRDIPTLRERVATSRRGLESGNAGVALPATPSPAGRPTPAQAAGARPESVGRDAAARKRVATRIGNHVGRAGASRAVCIAIPTRARRVLFALAHRAETRPTCALAPGITTAALRVAATATTTVEPAAQTCALAETLAGAATAAAGDDAAWSSDEVSS